MTKTEKDLIYEKFDAQQKQIDALRARVEELEKPPADAWLDAQQHATSAEEREEHAVANRCRRKRWDVIGMPMY